MREYVLTSERLGFRAWCDDDLGPFAAMNQDPKVMEFFPRLITDAESANGMANFNRHFKDHGFTYYAVDLLTSQEFVGFIGLKKQEFEHPLTPFVDIGWRLCCTAWGQGLATEGARACLNHGFQQLQIGTIYSLASVKNQRSIRVMQKIGMSFVDEFDHPRIDPGHPLQKCHLYSCDLV